jgi:hypothetical protein
LEAVASQDLWIWHAYFGLPGSNNDINVLDTSPLFKSLLNGEAPQCQFVVNGNTYRHGYYLADGIYPDWATLVKTISQPQGLERKYFAKVQEACRKDVERAFGVLQARFAIVSRPARGWRHGNLQLIMKACVILHNMIVEDERTLNVENFYDTSATISEVNLERSDARTDFSVFISNFRTLRSQATHITLRNDLIKHLWAMRGRSEDE